MNSDPPGEALASAALMMARRFHAGATLWSWSPAWPSDAAHVAVEFVHPVIVGKRALAAASVTNVGDLRRSSRPGDIVVVIGSGDDLEVAEAVARTPAWGVEAVWLASGAPPDAGTPGHVVWLGENAGRADVVCAYHLLWELAHVCFEHPRVLEARVEEAPACPACMDEGELGEVQLVEGPGEATVLVAGVPRSVDLSLVGGCAEGELVVVHAGVAITKLEQVRGG